MAVDIYGAIDFTDDPGDKFLHCSRGIHPDRIRDVDNCCPCFGCSTEDLDQVIRIGPCRIHRREHAELAMVTYVRDNLPGDIQYLFGSLFDRVHPLDLRGGNEDMHHVHIAIDADIDVLGPRSCQAADDRIKPEIRNQLSPSPVHLRMMQENRLRWRALRSMQAGGRCQVSVQR